MDLLSDRSEAPFAAELTLYVSQFAGLFDRPQREDDGVEQEQQHERTIGPCRKSAAVPLCVEKRYFLPPSPYVSKPCPTLHNKSQSV